MQFLGKLKIKSHKKITEFLNEEHVGRIATIDKNGFPQIIPMNFVFTNDFIYMHSHVIGEKLTNMKYNSKVGFEVDRELEYLPSYFENEYDASFADTLCISVVIKGNNHIIYNKNEKALALNSLMRKYQPEGRYKTIKQDMRILDAVKIIKIDPITITGKYKIGQHLTKSERYKLAKKILNKNSPTVITTLKTMGFETIGNQIKMINEPNW